MSEHISDGGEQEQDGDRIELSLSGTQFVEDPFRFWLHDGTGDRAGAPDRQLPHLSSVLVLTDLPEHVAVDPDLKASVARYLIQSDLDVPTPAELLRQIEQGLERPAEG